MNDDERLFKYILKCCKRANKPDLHSFTIWAKDGCAFVECRSHEVYIEINRKDGGKTQWCGTPIAAVTRLIKMGADFETIEV